MNPQRTLVASCLLATAALTACGDAQESVENDPALPRSGQAIETASEDAEFVDDVRENVQFVSTWADGEIISGAQGTCEDLGMAPSVNAWLNRFSRAAHNDGGDIPDVGKYIAYSVAQYCPQYEDEVKSWAVKTVSG